MKKIKTSKEMLDLFKYEIAPELLKEYELASKELKSKCYQFSDECEAFLLKASQRRHIITYRLLPRFIEKNKNDLDICKKYKFSEYTDLGIEKSIKEISNKYSNNQKLIMKSGDGIVFMAGRGKVEKNIEEFSQKVEEIELRLENECKKLKKQIPYMINLFEYGGLSNDYKNYGYMYEAIDILKKSNKIDNLFDMKKENLSNKDRLYLDNIKYALKNNCLNKLKIS